MGSPEERSATSPHNGEGPGDDQQKLGLGFQCLDEDDEAQYEKKLREGIEELVLGDRRLVREGLGEVDEGFDDDDGGMNRSGYNGDYSYPVRPDAEDCSYYMRVGSCKYGSGCKFNHPPNRTNQHPKAAKDKEHYYSQRPVKVECKYYMTSGGCKHGKACRFSHSRAQTGAALAVEFNFLGLPIRPGEMECSFYMHNGTCNYGSNCRFNHPEPTAVELDAPSGYVNGETVSSQAAPQTAMSSWSSPKSVNGNVPVFPVVYSPTNVVPAPNLEWGSYQAPVYPATERRLPTPPALVLNNPTETNFYTHHKLLMLVDEFPERPGEPDCNYFMKTGDCKYRSGCKFHHPKSRMPKSAPCALSDKGLPLRPDQQVCSYYTRHGLCKFGPACRYDHPVHHDNSVSTVSGPIRSPPFGRSGVANGGGNGKNASYVSERIKGLNI